MPARVRHVPLAAAPSWPAMSRVLSEILVHINRAMKAGQLQNRPGLEQMPKQFDKVVTRHTVCILSCLPNLCVN